MLTVVSSSLQPCVYFNIHGRVTWQVVDDDNQLGADGTEGCHVSQRQGLEAFSVRGQVVHRLSFSGQTFCVATFSGILPF